MSCPIKNQDWSDIVDKYGEDKAYLAFVRNDYNTPTLEEADTLLAESTVEIKQGVAELFEDNPELANEVYEALGFDNVITPNDKIVFGHPAIGKSFLKNQGEDKFISLDDDYATEINSKVKEIADKYNVTTYQVKDGGTQKWNNEYNLMMQEMFNVAKQKAISENKTLFTSNTNLLRNNAESFDKVINLTDKEFEKRIQKRGAKYDVKEWKSQINDAISKLPTNKVINTDKYLSDLFIASQQKQQAQQLYSQYLDTIFPDSKVKDIVYHASNTKFDKFNTPAHFGTLQAAKDIQSRYNQNTFYPSILNIYNDIYLEEQDYGSNYHSGLWNSGEFYKRLIKEKVVTAEELDNYYLPDKIRQYNINDIFISGEQLKVSDIYNAKSLSDSNDLDLKVEEKEVIKLLAVKYNSIIYKNNKEDKNSISYVVFEPEQIHILGSKQDIDGFKNFMKDKRVLPSLDVALDNPSFAAWFEDIRTTDRHSSDQDLIEYYTNCISKL